MEKWWKEHDIEGPIIEYFTLPHVFRPDPGGMVGMVGIW